MVVDVCNLIHRNVENLIMSNNITHFECFHYFELFDFI